MGGFSATSISRKSFSEDDRCSNDSGQLLRNGKGRRLDCYSVSDFQDYPLHFTRRPEQVRVLASLLAPFASEPNQLANVLLRKYGSISAIANANDAELRNISNDGELWADCLIFARSLIELGGREKLIRTKIDNNNKYLLKYLQGIFNRSGSEILIAVFLNEKNEYISDEVVASGSLNSIALSARNIFSRALGLDSRKIILAHNHPSGCSDPSCQDIEFTKNIYAQAKILGISLLDHLVFGDKIKSIMGVVYD